MHVAAVFSSTSADGEATELGDLDCTVAMVRLVSNLNRMSITFMRMSVVVFSTRGPARDMRT